ncbi:hypothetical protein ACFQ0G_25700 [Streptomyces chiangmaiensis]
MAAASGSGSVVTSATGSGTGSAATSAATSASGACAASGSGVCAAAAADSASASASSRSGCVETGVTGSASAVIVRSVDTSGEGSSIGVTCRGTVTLSNAADTRSCSSVGPDDCCAGISGVAADRVESAAGGSCAVAAAETVGSVVVGVSREGSPRRSAPCVSGRTRSAGE